MNNWHFKFIYKPYGYIEITKDNFGRDKIDSFFIYPEWRGQGFGRQLANFLPKKCWLVACASPNNSACRWLNKGLDQHNLILFYQSLGFKLTNKRAGIMKRGFK